MTSAHDLVVEWTTITVSGAILNPLGVSLNVRYLGIDMDILELLMTPTKGNQ